MTFKKGHKLNIGNTYCVGRTPWNKGKKVSENTRKNMRLARVGIQTTGMLGKHHSDKSKLKISLANIGKIVSLETKCIMSDSAKHRKPNFLGKKHSPEAKAKMSAARKANLLKKLGG